MPRRVLPTLSIFSRKSTNPTPAPTSPPPPDIRITSTPMTPPARLHLRHILPSTPDGMPTPPPPPRQPFPWLWQCHSCDTIYRIGCTRRCLVCSHEYCLSAAPKTRKGKKRRRSGMCVSEFDYSGWEEWGAWRRKVLGMENTSRTENQREQAFFREEHNCMTDCTYPSECHHVRYKLRKRTKTLLNMPPQDPDELQSPQIVSSKPSSPDDELTLDEVRVMSEEDTGEVEQGSPKSPLGKTTYPWDEPGPKEEKVWWVDTDEQNEDNQPDEADPEFIDIKLDNSGETDSSSSDAEGFSSDMLEAVLEEDESMMPLDLTDLVDTQDELKYYSREYPKHGSKLSVRNLTDADRGEDDDVSTDSSSESSSVSSKHSSSSSLDRESLVAAESTSPTENDNEDGENESEEKLEGQ
ncbi:hypothetical protein F5Y11DRAFT_315266 [Daldinia sp. FL1419]|nr:hypothetical protein F5Y11DRAFT_315266 [Daldinia sp. FL1419]